MTLKKFIEFFGAGGDLDDLRPSLVEFRCCGETHGNQFSCLSLKKTQTVQGGLIPFNYPLQ